MLRKLPPIFYNRTSVIGMTIFGLSFAMIVFLFILEAFAKRENAYLGLITFIALPAVMLFGLLIAVVGLIRTRRRMHRGEAEKQLPIIDLNQRRHFNAVNMILIGGFMLMFVSAFGTYQAYEYTESVEFCGTVCHSVMKPEYVAHQNSPHSSVACVECHIGEGAGSYIESKVAGTHQLIALMTNSFAKPIKTPVANMSEPHETCETCHSPTHNYSQQIIDRNYFLKDESNSQYQMSMLMKIGGSEHGQSEGIHAHMYLDKEISYVSTDRQRQIIPYVESKDKNGKVTIYRSTELPSKDPDLTKGERRKVDCIDCHNRPAHQYRHPEVSLNEVLSRGLIDRRIPEIKFVAVDTMMKPFKTEAEGVSTIKREILAYYKENYPDQAKSMSKEIDEAIRVIQRIYSTNFFPEMKTSWVSFPSNIDHTRALGCFRCHNDKLVSDTGKKISKDCQSCHTILSQMGPDGKRETNLKGLEFKHPVDIGTEWKTTNCVECHAPKE